MNTMEAMQVDCRYYSEDPEEDLRRQLAQTEALLASRLVIHPAPYAIRRSLTAELIFRQIERDAFN